MAELASAPPSTFNLKETGPLTRNAEPVISQAIELSEMKMTVRELDPLGRATNYLVPLPQSTRFEEWSVFQQAAMLKSGAWNKSPIGQIFYAIAYANRLGLDIMQGDVYTTGDGRIATSNKAKIKLALNKGILEDAPVFRTTEIDEEINVDGYDGPEIECTVTLRVKGWKTPFTKTQRLSEWYVAKNPNWKTRPKHMLEMNTLAHALEFVSPTETGEDEAPPTLSLTVPVVDVVAKQVAETIESV